MSDPPPYWATARDVERVEERLMKLEARINALFGGLLAAIAIINLVAIVIIAPLIAEAVRR